MKIYDALFISVSIYNSDSGDLIGIQEFFI